MAEYSVHRPDPGGRSPKRLEPAALEGHGWNVAETARAVGLSRGALYERLRKAGVRRPEADGAEVSD